MPWNYEASGTQAVVIAGVQATTSPLPGESSFLSSAITNAVAEINQFAAVNTFGGLHVVMRGHGGAKTFRNDLLIEAVFLDPQGRIIANAFPNKE